jgi:hypothetical protein
MDQTKQELIDIKEMNKKEEIKSLIGIGGVVGFRERKKWCVSVFTL